MTIGNATSSNPISYTPRQATSQPVSTERNPSEREQDGDRDDTVAQNAQVAPAKPVPAAVGKGLGLLIDVSL